MVQCLVFLKDSKLKSLKDDPTIPNHRGEWKEVIKISYDFLAMKNAGVNWVEALASYTEALNQDPKEELAWKSPFEIYFGRKPNVVQNTGNTCSKEWDLPLFTVW